MLRLVVALVISAIAGVLLATAPSGAATLPHHAPAPTIAIR